MKKDTLRTYALYILIALGVGLLAAAITGGSIESFQTEVVEPSWAPPAVLFPIVWAVLYILMGIGAARVSLKKSPEDPTGELRRGAIAAFILQLIFNFFWSLFFFNLRAFGFAFLWLIALLVLIVRMIAAFYPLDRPAAYLQIPYAAWVTFAGVLNYAIASLN
ncbi:MAG: tryptophan-rich sensory protein [Clostridia bacterium]|nr:tryptophan-rich sensory protein [Clostridia bacterium]